MAGLISIITSYIFELVFYKWSPRDNAVCAQVEVTSTICISFTCHSQFSPSPATSRIDFMLLYKYRTQMDPQYVEFQKTQSESRISTLHLQLSKVKVEVSQLCPILCDPVDYTVPGILQARILGWVAVPFSRGSSQSRDWTQVSHIAGKFFTSWATREAHDWV